MNWRRLLGATILAATAASAYVLACGPFLTEYPGVRRVYPAHPDAYREGRVGVVRPRFARRYLVQAYRRFTGQPALAPLVDDAPHPISVGTEETPAKEWLALRSTVGNDPVAKPRGIYVERRLPDYQSFTNCLDDAFANAIRTGKARIAQYGAESTRARDWFTAQDAVFENCDGKDGSDPILPRPAPAGADATARADREYQIASAYFYAMRYEEAAKRFRAIAEDSSSPWRPYGHYLAARALIRNATVPAVAALDPYLVPAQEDLRRTLNDPTAAALHASARGLLDLIAVRSRPIERLRALSVTVATGPAVTAQQVTDYRWLMDRLLGDTTEFAYASIGRHEAIAESSDLNDWILAMQGTGQAALDRTLVRWRATGQVQWLIAALWQVPPAHSETAGLLRAASAVRRTSPAFPTVSFLHARALFLRGERDAARAVLTDLPSRPVEGFEAETLNLLAALRMALAPTLGEFLQHAPRTIVASQDDGSAAGPPPAKAPPVFDEDAAVVFSQQLPLARLVEASTMTTLPARLRLRVAGAAFARATMLKNDDAMVAVAPVLRTLAPSLARDVARVEGAASPDARHIAAIRLLLRTPGLRAGVYGREDHITLEAREPARTFDHTFRRNWWCSFAPNQPERFVPSEGILELVYGSRRIMPPAFVTATEQTTAERELATLAALGPAPNYLAAEAIKWAREQPTDLDAAEALAHAVEGTRWGCTDAQTTASSRTAFQTLHKLFPKSEWARKTKYWY
jgi:hypothetical protein